MKADKTLTEIYKSILYRAADIYKIDYEDIDRDFGNRFDPVVRFLTGAIASELEKVYQHIDDTEMRLQKRLAEVLLPEYYHLPQPAHALLYARTSTDQLVLDETAQFEHKTEGDAKDVVFSPVFTTRVLPAEIKIIATDYEVIDVDNRPRLQRRKSVEEAQEVQRLLLGFESAEPISNWQGASLYFDIKGAAGDSSERLQLLAAVKRASCIVRRNVLRTRPGLPSQEIELEDKLNGNERYQNIVRARYENHFLTFSETEFPLQETESSALRLVEWFGQNERFEMTDTFRESLEENDRELYWLEIRLNRPVRISQAAARLHVRFNVFPVANRKLNGHEKGKHHWLRNQAIKWIQIEPEDDFVSIRKVYEENPPEYPEFTYKPFSEFREEQRPAYTLRMGGVGRWDNYNAWHRLSYLVNILQENFKKDELVEQAAGALSLEDIHQLLSKKIAGAPENASPSSTVYVLLHTGNKAGVRARVEYWTSIGEDANDIPAKTRLICNSAHKSRFDNQSIELVSPTADGKNPLNRTEQLMAMKSTLLGRDRIVTREDLKDFCKVHLGDKINEISITDTVGSDPRYDFGMTRMIQVMLHPSKNYIKEDWEGICLQVQTLIEQKSSSNIPYRIITNL